MNLRPSPLAIATRLILLVDGLVFVAAALLNLGLRIPLGFAELAFPSPIWQAGMGELAIGAALLAAGVTMRTGLAWAAFLLSVVGILFGLSSSRVQGPARDVHLLLVPLALLLLALLATCRLLDRPSRKPTTQARPQPLSPTVELVALVLLAGLAVAFAAASAVHAGAVVSLGSLLVADRFAGAAAPEGIIALVLGLAAVALALRWDARFQIALGATLFSTALTLFGLTITLGSGRTADIAYHVAVLSVLLVTLATLVLPMALARPRQG